MKVADPEAVVLTIWVLAIPFMLPVEADIVIGTFAVVTFALAVS